MLKLVSCSQTVYGNLMAFLGRPFIKRFVTESGDWSQMNISVFGITVAYTQPNVIGEYGEPDFFWCRKFLRYLF